MPCAVRFHLTIQFLGIILRIRYPFNAILFSVQLFKKKLSVCTVISKAKKCFEIFILLLRDPHSKNPFEAFHLFLCLLGTFNLLALNWKKTYLVVHRYTNGWSFPVSDMCWKITFWYLRPWLSMSFMEKSSLYFSSSHLELVFWKIVDFLLVILTNNKQASLLFS